MALEAPRIVNSKPVSIRRGLLSVAALNALTRARYVMVASNLTHLLLIYYRQVCVETKNGKNGRYGLEGEFAPHPPAAEEEEREDRKNPDRRTTGLAALVVVAQNRKTPWLRPAVKDAGEHLGKFNEDVAHVISRQRGA